MSAMQRRLRFRVIRVGAILAIAAGITVATNVALLGYAANRHDPVGRLSTKQNPTATSTGRTPTAPTRTTTAPPTRSTTSPVKTTRSPSSTTVTHPPDDHRSGTGNGGKGRGKPEDD